MEAAVLEPQPRPDDEVLDGARREHLAGPCARHHPRADVDGDPGHVVANELALAGVQAGADL
jgi:hypothetical protein